MNKDDISKHIYNTKKSSERSIWDILADDPENLEILNKIGVISDEDYLLRQL